MKISHVEVLHTRIYLIKNVFAFLLTLLLVLTPSLAADEKDEKSGKDVHADDNHSRLSDVPIPLQLDDFPGRTPPLFEWPNRFLGNGNLSKGFQLPTGAVWQPYLVVFGNYRSGLQHFNTSRDNSISEWANNLDLFANLYLTFTERILIGFQPLQQDGGFTGFNFNSANQGFQDRTNFNITTLFFEGDFGELFPFLDKHDSKHWDIGFSVGRQLLNFQEGLLINDIVDAVGVTSVNLKLPSTINTRVTLLYGWNQLNRTATPGSNFEDDLASMTALFTETDWQKSTVAFDAIYVNGDSTAGDGLYYGIDAVQRMGHFNTSFRLVGSQPIGVETDYNSSGLVLFGEVSKTPIGTHNHLYLNGYWGINKFRSAARSPAAGGALGRTGILYSAVGLGQFGSALNNFADDSFGAALGYQMFFSHNRKQLILEAGSRYATNISGQRATAFGARFQTAIRQRFILALDGFSAYDYSNSASQFSTTSNFQFGSRLEFQVKL
ncbi:MAG: hypothetical protein ACRBF0_04010 [Calditrichia bacterium]